MNQPADKYASQRRWNGRNPEKVKASNAAWNKRNPNYYREYYLANRERVLRLGAMRRKIHRARYNAISKAWRLSPRGQSWYAVWRKKNQKKQIEAARRWDRRNVHKIKTYHKVSAAVKNGIINKTPCGTCGSNNVRAFHNDYSKPLDVTWACRMHPPSKRVKAVRRVVNAVMSVVGL